MCLLVLITNPTPATHFKGHAKQMRSELRATLSSMQPNLAQVLNTLAHEIRTPLAVSQGYLKLYLDGRFTNAEDTRKAFEQTRQALGTLATLCVDMGQVSALSERESPSGVPEHLSVADFIKSLRAANPAIGCSRRATIASWCRPSQLLRRRRSTKRKRRRTSSRRTSRTS